MSLLKTQYLNSMDAARAILAIAGIFLHASLAYMVPLSEFSHWPVFSAHKSWAFDFLALWIHAFRMPTFFFLAGFFASLTYQKTGIYSLMKKRLWRIAIPFVVIFLFPVILWIVSSWTLYRTIHLQLIWQQINDLGPYWFLYYLLLMYACIFLIWTGMTVVSKFYMPKISITQLFKKPTVKIGFFLLTVSCLFLTGYRILPYSSTLKPFFSLFSFYFMFFLAGWIANHIKLDFKLCAQYCFHFLSVSGLIYVIYFILFISDKNYWEIRLMIDACIVSIAGLFILGFLGFTFRYFNAPSRIWNYLARASYWIYLVHVSIIIALQELFNFVSIPIGLKYLSICAITLLICLGSYHVLVRNTKLGLLLNGRRIKDDHEGNASATNAPAAASRENYKTIGSI